MLKKFTLTLSITYSMALLVGCLMNPEDIPDLKYDDKLLHFLAYFILTLLWFASYKYHFKRRWRNAIIKACVFSIVFGIIIEALQHILTAYRTLDIYDVVANTLGVILAAATVVLKNNIRVKKI